MAVMVALRHKSDMAWRFTCLGFGATPPWTKAHTAHISGRGPDMITNTRRVRNNLIAKIEAGEITDVTVTALAELSWAAAMALDRDGGLPTWDDERLERAVMAGVRKLRKAFKGGPIRNPDMFARILAAYDGDLPLALMQSEPWWDARRDMEREEQEAREEAKAEGFESDF